MGALDKKIFSGAAFAAALLFVVSAVMLFTGDVKLTADTNTIALYVLVVAGILTIVYSVPMIKDGASFVRRIAGIILAVSGVVFLAVPFVGGNADTVLAIAGIVAGLALVMDMLAMWVSRVYGVMYVSAVLAAVDLVMGIMCLVKGYNPSFVLVMLIAFALWLVIGGWVSGFMEIEGEVKSTKTREIIESSVSKKKDKPQAQNKKATPKAKKFESKKEASASEVTDDSAKAEQPKKVRTVELPKTAASQAAIQKSQVQTEPKREEVAPAKATGDFMAKLMSSQAASKAIKKESVEVKPEVAPEAPSAEETTEEIVVEETVEEVIEDVPAEEIVVEETVEEEIIDDVPMESVIAQPVESKTDDMFKVAEPDWGSGSIVAPEVPSAEETTEETVEEVIEDAAPEIEETTEETVEETTEEILVEETVEIVERVEPTKVTVMEDPEESVIAQSVEAPAEESVTEPAPEPNWDVVASDIDADVPAEESVTEETVEASEDVYTDNSPEALVRRAAWNKGLRCRRSYGEFSIPVAFVKGKVAVFVEDCEADPAVDDALRADGWTILRFKASDITDGKDQGEIIAAAVKENTKATKKTKRSKK